MSKLRGEKGQQWSKNDFSWGANGARWKRVMQLQVTLQATEEIMSLAAKN